MIFSSKKGVQSARLSTDLLQPGTPLSSIYPKYSRCGCPVLVINVLEVKHCEATESTQGRVSGDICFFHSSLKILVLHFAFVLAVTLSLPFDASQFSNQQTWASTACFAKVLCFEKDTDPLEIAGEEYPGKHDPRGRKDKWYCSLYRKPRWDRITVKVTAKWKGLSLCTSLRTRKEVKVLSCSKEDMDWILSYLL